MPLDLTCNDTQKIKITVTPTTASGAAAQLDNPVNVTVTSGDATVETVDDTNFYVVAGAPGNSTFLVEGDADLGDGVVLLQDTVSLIVISEMATSFGMTAGQPEAKTATRSVKK